MIIEFGNINITLEAKEFYQLKNIINMMYRVVIECRECEVDKMLTQYGYVSHNERVELGKLLDEFSNKINYYGDD